MKKTFGILVIGLLFALTVSSVNAQETNSGRNVRFTIKTNPLAALGGPFWVIVIPITGEYKVLFEMVVSEKSSLQLGAGYLGPSILVNLDELSSTEGSISGIKTSGFRVQGMYKLFLSRDLSAPAGFYLGPHVSFAKATLESKDNPVDNLGADKLNINAVIGYQLITSGGFTLDVYTGMGFVSRNWVVSGTNFDQSDFKDKKSVSIPFAVSFGYAF